MIKDKYILIVEDNYTISFFTQSLLKKKGYENIEIAVSGEEAVEMSETRMPDLILMDIVLEGELNGVEAAKIIQQKAPVPVIYLTANTDEDTVTAAESTFHLGFIRKPYMPAELLSCVEKALNPDSA